MTNYSQQLAEAISDLNVTGASFAYWDGTHLHTAVAGARNSVTGDPVTVDTVMHIGSITKILNTVLLLQLVDEGKIALEDPVERHLPNLRLGDSEALRKITCAMLVNHTSGIEGEVLADHGPDQERIVDAISRFADFGQLHAPGEGPSYSNVGTVIAGYLIEEIRRSSWYTLIRTRIYETLGMRHAIAHPTELPRFRQSVGDVTDLSTGRPVQTTRPFLAPSFAPCGTTLMMSATDLVVFGRALVSGGVGPNGARILTAASAERMARPTVAMVHPPGAQWGLGWMCLPGGLLQHSGGGPGVSSFLYAHPASGGVLALLTNSDRGVVLESRLVDPITEAWTGLRRPTTKRQSGVVDLRPYEGTYEGVFQRVEVSAHDGGLSVRLLPKTRHYDNTPKDAFTEVTLFSLGDHTFEGQLWLPDVPSMIWKFLQPDSHGSMQAVSMAGIMLMTRRAESASSVDSGSV